MKIKIQMKQFKPQQQKFLTYSQLKSINKKEQSMLAPSYRQNSRRQRGISLSRTSSHQKIQYSVNRQVKDCLSQSFECHEPICGFGQDNNLESENVLKERNENRLSVMPEKYKSCRQQKPKIGSHRRKGSTLHSNTHTLSQSKMHVGHSPQAQSIHEMIQLLEQYQKQCQRQMDLQSAEQARKRINQLKLEEIRTRRKELEVQKKEYGIKTRREGQEEKREFYEFWDNKVLEARQALKEIEEKHLQQQRKELVEYEKRVILEPCPAIKYSSKVLQTRRNLTSLIKSRKYKQAQHLKELLARRQAQQQQKWTLVCEQKKHLKIKQFKKKQLIQLQAFKLKLNSSFNQLIKEKEKQEERMTKKIKKMEVEAQKVPPALVKTKKNLLNQSKANIDNQDSKY